MMNLDVYKSGTARYSSKFYLMLIKNLFYFTSLYCFKLGIAPQIEDLYGKVQFTGNVRIIHHDKSPSDHHKCLVAKDHYGFNFLVSYSPVYKICHLQSTI